jgi:hypothetical protein
LATLDPRALEIPDRILKLIPPSAHGYVRTRENFHGRTSVTFDPQSAVEAAADLTVGLLLQPERATRLVDYHARDANNPGLDEVIDKLIRAAWKTPPVGGEAAEVSRTIGNVLLYRLMKLAADPSASEQARAVAFAKLDDLRVWLGSVKPRDPLQGAHYRFAAHQIELYEKNPKDIQVTAPAAPPDGSPI